MQFCRMFWQAINHRALCLFAHSFDKFTSLIVSKKGHLIFIDNNESKTRKKSHFLNPNQMSMPYIFAPTIVTMDVEIWLICKWQFTLPLPFLTNISFSCSYYWCVFVQLWCSPLKQINPILSQYNIALPQGPMLWCRSLIFN